MMPERKAKLRLVSFIRFGRDNLGTFPHGSRPSETWKLKLCLESFSPSVLSVFQAICNSRFAEFQHLVTSTLSVANC